jgi:hypothetical protein
LRHRSKAASRNSGSKAARQQGAVE